MPLDLQDLDLDADGSLVGHPSSPAPSLRQMRAARRAKMVRSDLPPPGVGRWSVRRKAEVVAAVRTQVISLQEAMDLYSLSEAEFRSWEEAIDRHGMSGLRATRFQEYREASAGDDSEF
jgi:hypothetical protein